MEDFYIDSSMECVFSATALKWGQGAILGTITWLYHSNTRSYLLEMSKISWLLIFCHVCSRYLCFSVNKKGYIEYPIVGVTCNGVHRTPRFWIPLIKYYILQQLSLCLTSWCQEWDKNTKNILNQQCDGLQIMWLFSILKWGCQWSSWTNWIIVEPNGQPVIFGEFSHTFWINLHLFDN